MDNLIIYEIGEAKYNVTLIVDQTGTSNLFHRFFYSRRQRYDSYASPIEIRTGYYLSHDELPTVAPAAGHRFVGWRTESQDWLSGFGLEIKTRYTIDAVLKRVN